MSILESYSQERPVLAPDDRQFAEMIVPGETGEHYRADDAKSFEEAVSRILAGDSRRRKYPNIGRYFMEHHSQKAGLARLEDIYRSAIENRTLRKGDGRCG